MVITDPVLLEGRDAVATCQAAVRGGATMVQVRWKDGAPAEVLQLTRALVATLSVPVLVNDRVDIALAAGAAGAHLGWDDPPLEALRPHVPAGFVLGISVGNAEEATHAAAASADYWSIGPCFGTPTKPDAGSPLGPDGFAELARLVPDGVPVIGIGGITATNVASIMQAGAAGVAVIGAVFGADDPGRGARAMRAAMSSTLPRRG